MTESDLSAIARVCLDLVQLLKSPFHKKNGSGGCVVRMPDTDVKPDTVIARDARAIRAQEMTVDASDDCDDEDRAVLDEKGIEASEFGSLIWEPSSSEAVRII